MEQNKEIDVLKILFAVKKRLIFVVLAAVIGAAAMFFYTRFFAVPMYRAEALVYISNKVTYNTGTDSVDRTDIDSSVQLVPVYRSIIKTNAALDKVSQSCGLPYTTKQISSMISTSQIEETAVMRISASAPVAEHCSVLANSVATTGISEITKFAPGSSAYIIDEAETPSAPYSPSMKKNMILGFFVGAMIVIAATVVLELMDTRLKGEEELAGVIGAPVLGVIGKQELQS